MTKQGIVLKGIGGFYYVECDGEIYECKPRGSFRNKNISPYPGDHVIISVDENPIESIEEICERKNFFQRPTVANIDRLFIVVSATQPEPNLLVIDKMLSIAQYKEIEPILIFTKTDIKNCDDIMKIYSDSGFLVYSISPDNTDQKKEILALFRDRVSILSGNSGVGKSTLLNTIFSDLELETSVISVKLGRGKHTTRQTELYPVKGGGYIGDTPGFSTVEISRYERILKDQLQYTFIEFSPYIMKCKYTGCSHTKEDGCAVISAVKSGDIKPSRHKNYCMLYEDAKKIKEWELKLK